MKRAGEEREALRRWRARRAATSPSRRGTGAIFAEKERKARYDVDEATTRPYLLLDNVIAAAFDTASRLFGLKFKELQGRAALPSGRARVGGDDKRGDHVGVFLGDYFARPSKRSGAWMSSFRSQYEGAARARSRSSST